MMKEFKPVAIIIGTTIALTFVIGICCIIGSNISSIIGTAILIIMTETSEWLSRKLFTIIGYGIVYDEVKRIYDILFMPNHSYRQNIKILSVFLLKWKVF